MLSSWRKGRKMSLLLVVVYMTFTVICQPNNSKCYIYTTIQLLTCSQIKKCLLTSHTAMFWDLDLCIFWKGCDQNPLLYSFHNGTRMTREPQWNMLATVDECSIQCKQSSWLMLRVPVTKLLMTRCHKVELCQEPEELSTRFFWWRPLIEAEMSSF